MLRSPTPLALDENLFEHPLINAIDARRQFVISAVLVSAFAFLACLSWLA